jgi:hypothetical protein
MDTAGHTTARQLDFGELPSRRTITLSFRRGLHLAMLGGTRGAQLQLRGPDKYRALDLRRRLAQLRARHALGL